MALAIEPLHPLYGARLHGVDIRAPIGEEIFAQIRAAMATYAVCLIGHDAPPSNEAHIALSARLGPLQRSAQKIAGTGERVPYPEIVDQSNLDEVGEIYADSTGASLTSARTASGTKTLAFMTCARRIPCWRRTPFRQVVRKRSSTTCAPCGMRCHRASRTRAGSGNLNRWDKWIFRATAA
jgi:hypothetical protein